LTQSIYEMASCRLAPETSVVMVHELADHLIDSRSAGSVLIVG
jgi:hypothetical protein